MEEKAIELKAIVPHNDDLLAKGDEQNSVEMSQVQARTISKFAEASILEYTDREREILFAAIEPNEIKVRPDGQVYLEWAWYAERLDAAFGQGQWSLSPAPWNPRLYRENNITYREYVLWIRGQFAGNAVGHHEEQRRTANFGDAAEATYANALVRCCKRIGMARDLWKKDKIDEFKQFLLTKKQDKARGSLTDRPTVNESPSDPAPQPSTVSAEFAQFSEQLRHAESMQSLRTVWAKVWKLNGKLPETEMLRLEVIKNEKKEILSNENSKQH